MKLADDELEIFVGKFLPEIKIMAHKYYIAGGSEDDLVQEGLIGLVDGVNSYDESYGDVDSDAFKAFVLMCAKRQILDAIKRANSKRNTVLNNSLSLNDIDGGISEGVSSLLSNETPEDIVIERCEKEEASREISIKLSEQEKMVLDLYLDGLKQSEIAIKLDKSVKSIDNSLQRIKNKIKGRL